MKRPLVITGAVSATLAAAILSAPAGAWDDKPCGATEATAHVCAPGEVARDGSTPNLAPVVVIPTPTPTPTPEPTPGPVLTPTPTPSPTPAATALTCARLPRGAGIKWRRKAHCASPPPPVLTCADLNARRAGQLWLAKFGCEVPQRLRRVGPFEPAVAG